MRLLLNSNFSARLRSEHLSAISNQNISTFTFRATFIAVLIQTVLLPSTGIPGAVLITTIVLLPIVIFKCKDNLLVLFALMLSGIVSAPIVSIACSTLITFITTLG